MLKRSLHVGLNYPGTSAELAGCVNDAIDWRDLFHGLGYSTVMLAEPTGVEMLTAIQAQLKGLRRGDRFVLTYSGHGSFVPDRNGDEIDGFDEVLCPSDYQSRVVTDDDLSRVFDSAALGVRKTFLSDSCHSGTVNRFAPLAVGLVAQLNAKARFMPPSEFLPARDIDAVLAASPVTKVIPGATRVPAALISGCADHEYSYDAWFGSRANGAFSRVAIDAFRPTIRMVEWWRTIRSGLPSPSFPQTPQLQARFHQRYWKF